MRRLAWALWTLVRLNAFELRATLAMALGVLCLLPLMASSDLGGAGLAADSIGGGSLGGGALGGADKPVKGAAWDADIVALSPTLLLDSSDLDGDDTDNSAWSDGDPITAAAPWTNKGSTSDTFGQSTAADQPTIEIPCPSAAGGDGGAAGCVSFDGGDCLTSAGTTATWKELHDSAETCFVVLEPTASPATGYYAATMNPLNTKVGYVLGHTGPDKAYSLVGNGGGAAFSHDLLSTTTETLNSTHLVTVKTGPAGAGNDGELWLNRTSEDTEEPIAAALSSANSDVVLTIGSRDPSGCSANQFSGYLYYLVCFNSALSAGDISTIETALESRYGSMPN